MREYAEEVLGSKASLRVLRVLLRYRGKVFTVRETARSAGLSHPQVSAVLKELERRGIVNLQLVGTAYQVSLNERSYFLKTAIEPIFSAEEATIDYLVSTIREFFKDRAIISVAIFGSVAGATEKSSSDIDLLIIARDKETANERAAKASVETRSRFGHAISPLIMTGEHFVRNRDSDLEKSILSSYTMVSGVDLKEILERGENGR